MCPKLTELLSWNGLTVHVCCFMLARAPTKKIRQSNPHSLTESKKQRKKIFFIRKIRQQGHSLAEVSLYFIRPFMFAAMLARIHQKKFVSRTHIRQPNPNSLAESKKQRKKSSLSEKFVSKVTRQPRYHCSLFAIHFSCRIYHQFQYR